MFFIIYLLPILIFIAIRWFQAEPGSSVKDLFSTPECKKCTSKHCLFCEHKEENEALLAFMIAPILNIIVLLAWLLGKLIALIPIEELWNKFINSKVKKEECPSFI